MVESLINPSTRFTLLVNSIVVSGIMEFELVLKINTNVSVHFSGVNKYSIERARTIVMHCTKVQVLAFGNIKFLSFMSLCNAM